MDEINPEFIERYQLLYEKNPQSKIFAPLAEAYRKMGLLTEALEIARSGVSLHPEFAGGHLTLGKILLEDKKWNEAGVHLQKAVELSPENILAQSLLADLLIRLKDPKGALKAYKMLLFLQPQNEKARKAVAKLESLTADEYEADVFAMQPLKEAVRQRDDRAVALIPLEDSSPTAETTSTHLKVLERFISLADAFLVRNDVEQAQQTLEEAEKQLGQHHEITKRYRLLRDSLHPSESPRSTSPNPSLSPPPIKDRQTQSREGKENMLKQLLRHVASVRTSRKEL